MKLSQGSFDRHRSGIIAAGREDMKNMLQLPADIADSQPEDTERTSDVCFSRKRVFHASNI